VTEKLFWRTIRDEESCPREASRRLREVKLGLRKALIERPPESECETVGVGLF